MATKTRPTAATDAEAVLVQHIRKLGKELDDSIAALMRSQPQAYDFLNEATRIFLANVGVAVALVGELRRDVDDTTGELPPNYVVFGMTPDGEKCQMFQARNTSEVTAFSGVHAGKLVFADRANATCAFQTRHGFFIALRRRPVSRGARTIARFGSSASEG